MILHSRNLLLALAACASLLLLAASGQQPSSRRKPEIVLTAVPIVSFAPAKIRFTADLRGGDDDFEEFYCASVEWDWDDGTRSEAEAGCDPYESGRSRIRRHFSAEHKYEAADDYHPVFRLKKRDKVVAQARTDVEVRPGLVQ